MATLPEFDFRHALGLSPGDRIADCIERARAMLEGSAGVGPLGWPIAPRAAPDRVSVARLESEPGLVLPSEYALFLAEYDYLYLSTGLSVGGPFPGDSPAPSPWISTSHVPDRPHLVFGEYWNHADGDDLLFDLVEGSGQVLVYLHEAGPAIEVFAPSLSLAIWRMFTEFEKGRSS